MGRGWRLRTSAIATILAVGALVPTAAASARLSEPPPLSLTMAASWTGYATSADPGRAFAQVTGPAGTQLTVRFFTAPGPTCPEDVDGPGVTELPTQTVTLDQGGYGSASSTGTITEDDLVLAVASDGTWTSQLGCAPVFIGRVGKPHVTSASTTSITLAWDEVPGAEGYEVRVEKRAYQAVKTVELTPGPGGEITGLAPGGVYRMIVEATSSTHGVVGAAYVDGDAAGGGLKSFVVPPFGSFKRLVDRQYQDFIGHHATFVEIVGWERMALSNMTTSEMIATLVDSRSWGGERAPVIRLYDAFFQRRPDGAGLDYWAVRRRSGMTVRSIADRFARSSEFSRTYGSLSDGAFVDLVYRNVLHREPDAEGKRYWVGQLATRRTSRGGLMASFSESSEHEAKTQPTVDAILVFKAMLRRMPTADEYATWAPASDAPPRKAVIFSILSSAAYDARINP